MALTTTPNSLSTDTVEATLTPAARVPRKFWITGRQVALIAAAELVMFAAAVAAITTQGHLQ